MKLSVIVCTRNRADRLVGCLDAAEVAIAAAGLTTGEAEIVVVDNGSTDATPALLRRRRETGRLALRIVEEARPGLSVARNAGVRAAAGALLACTDDDCNMVPDYVERALGYDREDGDRLVLRGGGAALGDATDLPLGTKTFPERARWTLANDDARDFNLGNSLVGCNLTFRKALAERVGPFDEKLGAGSGIPGGEDTDFVFRAYLAGCDIEYVPNMMVVHFHGRKTLAEARALLTNYAIGWGGLAAKYWRTNPILVKQLRWDAKNLVLDTVFRRNSFMPEIDFSYRDKLRHQVTGFMRYHRRSA